MSDIFREIDEELRRDNLLKLWSRYGRYLIAFVVLVLLVAGGIVAWRDHQASLRRAQATRYWGALTLAETGKPGDAAKLFGLIAQEGGGYGLLASFEQAALLAKSGDDKGAIAVYDRIAASGVGPPFRGLAVLLSAMHGLSLPHADPQAALARLAPLTQAGNPWRPSAVELTALAKLRAGDKKGALTLFKSLADDLSAPPGLRSRAAEMAAALAA